MENEENSGWMRSVVNSGEASGVRVKRDAAAWRDSASRVLV